MTIKQAIQKRNKLRAEGRKLRAEGRKLRAEGNLLVINAVINKHGPKATIRYDELVTVVACFAKAAKQDVVYLSIELPKG